MNKKTLNICTIMMLILSALVVSVNTVNAEMDPKTIYGTLYIDTNNDGTYEIAEAGIEITAEVEDYTKTVQTFQFDEINYMLGIEPGHTNQTCFLNITYSGKTFSPDENKSIVLSEENENGGEPGYYNLDLYATITDEAPSQVEELTVEDAKDGKLDLEWNPATDDFGIDHYSIYWDQDDYEKPIHNVTHPDTSYTHSDLSNGIIYCYKVLAVDTVGNKGPFSEEKCNTPTKTQTGGGTGGGSGGTGGSGGSGDDSNGGTGGDDSPTGDEGDDEPPINPNIGPVAVDFDTKDGNYVGTINQNISFYAIGRDIDSNQVNYTFDWNDGDTDYTGFIDNSTIYNINHTFTSLGIYNVKFEVIDDYNSIDIITLQILIDVEIIDDSDNNVDGYLQDDDGDGEYDTFYNNEDDSETSTNKENGSYLIDTDNDGEFDYRYNTETDTGETIEDEDDEGNEDSKDTKKEQDNNMIYYIAGIILVFVLLILLYLATRKKEDKK